ncbi:MAG TPA: fibronectin type III domain-containing protein, partial [Candidatus Methylacidiphilales bacterium]|nr:fibronectin type III domain-containing protein [Candidatus Methylacidiphilales bacterium]
WTKASGNVVFAYGRKIRFLGDAFVHLGGAGLELGHGSQSDIVQGSVFTDISGNGLELGGVDLPEASAEQVTRDNKILNNHIYNVAAEFHGGIGICVGYAQRTVIQHNQIDHLPYTGISMGWGGWPDKIEKPGVANNSENNLVANNLIFNHMQLLADGGGIYTQGLTGPSLADGEKLIGNVIHDQYGSGHGIYTDNGCNNVTAKGNVIFHTYHDNWGGRHKNYYDGNAGKTNDAFDGEGNYWQQGDRDGSAQGVTLKDNHLISSLDQAPASILQNAGLQEPFKHILNERFCDPATPESPSRVAVASENGSAYIAWNPPQFDGGSAVISYTVSSSKGDQVTISADDYQSKGYAIIPGLSQGVAYTFTVTSHNANGDSSPSIPSAEITVNAKPAAVPPAPPKVTVFPGNGMVSIHFQSPFPPTISDGGSPILGYVCTVNPGGREVPITGYGVLAISDTTHTTFRVIDGLQNGTTYTFELAAVNAAGTGAKAAPVTATPLDKL